MKKNPFPPSLVTVLSVVAASSGAQAQAQEVVCALSPVMPNYSPLADQAPTARTAKDLKKLTGSVCPQGCGRVSLYQNATIPNALTVSTGGGSSRIEYSPAFLDKVQELFGQDARYGVLAHEFGHHVDLNGVHGPWIDSSWTAEMRADSWAGCALAKAGMKTQGVKEALRAVAASQPSKADQHWDQRWVALQAGYDGCGTGGSKKQAMLEPLAKVAMTGGGCSSNAECKMGRLCVDGRCENSSLARGTCMKDVDCPDGQICTAVGRCDAPAGSGQFVSAAAVTAAPPKVDPRACRKECGVERKQCRVGAMKSLNACLQEITSDQAYKDCHCPSWSGAKPECFQVCEAAFDKADKCESEYAPGKEACVAGAPSCKDCL